MEWWWIYWGALLVTWVIIGWALRAGYQTRKVAREAHERTYQSLIEQRNFYAKLAGVQVPTDKEASLIMAKLEADWSRQRDTPTDDAADWA